MPTYRVGRVRIYIDNAGLRRYARDLPEVKEGVQATASAIAGDARLHAPVRTGRLRDSIGTERAVRAGRESQTVRVVARVFYARFVEFGTRHMPPQPFLRPAANRYRQPRIRG
jgi:HK97 gp10 family phage protein